MPAENFQTDALAELLAGENFHQSHLSGPTDMGAAAGAAVRLGEGDDPHGASQLLFAAVGQMGQSVRVGIGDFHRRSAQITALAAASAA